MKNIIQLSYIFCFIFSFFSAGGQIKNCPDPRNDSGLPPGCFLCNTQIQDNNRSSFAFIPYNAHFPCGTHGRMSYYTLLSDTSGKIEIEISVQNCSNGNETEILFYDLMFNPVSNCFSVLESDGMKIIGVDGLIPSEFYTLLINGVNLVTCDITIESLIKHPPPVDLPIQNLVFSSSKDFNNLCIGDTFCLTVNPIFSVNNYYWNLPLGLIPISKPSFNEICVKVQPYPYQKGDVSVTAFTNCEISFTSDIKSFDNSDQNIIHDLDIEVCPDKLPITVRGNLISELGFQFIFQSNPNSECDRVYDIWIKEASERIAVIDTAICIGHNYIYRTRKIKEPGFYEFTIPSSDSLQCDSIIKLNLSISGDVPPEIQCVYDTFLNVLSINWGDIRLADGYFVLINGDTVSEQSHRGFFYKPNQLGEQIDLKIQPYNSRGCSFEAGITTCFAEPTSSVFEENLVEKIRVFPNPSDGLFQIESEILVEKTTVLNVFGERFFESKTTEIDLSNFPEGIYFFKIKTKKGVVIRKVLKN